MNLKEALDALLSGREITPAARELLSDFDPEALKEELGALRSQLEEQENAKLSAEELLKKQLNTALSEKEELLRQHELLERSTSIHKRAAEYGCEDPDYLDFLARKQAVDLKDPAAAAEFVRSAAQMKPHCFRAPLQPGSGTGFPAVAPETPPAGADRISRIVSSLDTAPVLS